MLKFLNMLSPDCLPQPNLGNASYHGMSCPYLRNASLPDTPDLLLNWLIDPEYTMFEGCQCARGSAMTLVRLERGGFPVFQCVFTPPPSNTWLERMPWIFVLIAIGVSAALLAGTW